MNIQVTSVSKTEQKLSTIASAVFVITQEDIQNSGATNIPDLLRIVPGISVAQIDSNTWAITARGFNARFSNELLVLVDGRSVYTQSTGGVYWDVLDLPLEDIERVEVIRGPGGSVWGANAVNGVINIMTKKASETRGSMIVAGGGNIEPAFSTLQYGRALGSATNFRVFGKYSDFNNLPNPPGQQATDNWHVLRGGFRADTAFSPRDTAIFEGDMYSGREGVNMAFAPSPLAPGIGNAYNVRLSGGFLQGSWKHSFSDRSDTSLLASYDNYEREDILHDRRSTFDVQFQHHFLWGSRQNLIWGLEDRYSMSHTHGNFFVSFNPANIDTNLFGTFLQDEITAIPNRVFVTFGTKIEHDYYTQWNAMPSARIAWTPSPRQTLWGAVSRSVRTPADFDAALRVNEETLPNPGGPPLVLAVLGNPHVRGERLFAYELGYRREITRRAAIDLAMYYNHYSTQETTEPGTPFLESSPAPVYLVMPFITETLMWGETHGLELSAHWNATSCWTLSSGYVFEEIHMHLKPTSQDTDSVPQAEGSTPDNSAQIRSHLNLAQGLAWDASAYFSGRLTDPVEPSYTRLDTGFSWRFAERSSLAIFGQNLLKDRHMEFSDSSGSALTTFVKRSVYLKFTVEF